MNVVRSAGFVTRSEATTVTPHRNLVDWEIVMFKPQRFVSSLSLSLALPLAVSAILIAGCSSEATTAPAQPAASVTVAAALQKQVTEWDEFTGRFEAF